MHRSTSSASFGLPMANKNLGLSGNQCINNAPSADTKQPIKINNRHGFIGNASSECCNTAIAISGCKISDDIMQLDNSDK